MPETLLTSVIPDNLHIFDFFFSQVLDLLKTFLTKPSHVLRGFQNFKNRQQMHSKVFVSPLNTSGEDDMAGGTSSVCDEIVGTTLRNCVRYNWQQNK